MERLTNMFWGKSLNTETIPDIKIEDVRTGDIILLFVPINLILIK